jgi:hypothetical protein
MEGFALMATELRTPHESVRNRLVSSEPFFPTLVPGPSWNSFEQLRVGGNAALDAIPKHSVATLRSKTGTFRVLHEEDFQRLFGLASEIHRLKGGLKLIISAARVYSKFRDNEHEALLMDAVSAFAGSPVLPERDGHAEFEITAEEKAAQGSDDFDVETANIPRPEL